MLSRPRLHKEGKGGEEGWKRKAAEGGGILYALTLGLMEKQQPAADERAHKTIYPPVRRGWVRRAIGNCFRCAPRPLLRILVKIDREGARRVRNSNLG